MGDEAGNLTESFDQLVQMEADLEELTRKMLLGMEGELQEEPDSLGQYLYYCRNCVVIIFMCF